MYTVSFLKRMYSVKSVKLEIFKEVRKIFAGDNIT